MVPERDTVQPDRPAARLSPEFTQRAPLAPHRGALTMPAAVKTRTLVDRSRTLAWNALTILVFVILTTYVARADGLALAVVGG